MYRQFQADADAAAAKFRITARGHYSLGNVLYLEAEAGTGTRYSVLVTTLPSAATNEGGDYLVSVMSPFWKCWPVSGNSLGMTYVAEKFYPKDRSVHGGDLQALTVLINEALR